MRKFKFTLVALSILLILAMVVFPVAAFAKAPSVGTWTPAGPMNIARAFQSATLLNDGRVLVAGGYSVTDGVPNNFVAPNIADAEIYNPQSGAWTATGSMNEARAAHTATLLQNGKVLVTGGFDAYFNVLQSAELYDPSTGTWSETGPMTMPRTEHRAILLPDGRVLVVGGNIGGSPESPTLTASAELYNPQTGTWTATTSMSVPREEMTVSLLTGMGQQGFGYVVLVAGGDGGGALASAELYNPKTGAWTTTGSMNIARADAAAVYLRGNGKVLVLGGYGFSLGPPSYLNSAELYDPKTGNWTLTGAMASPRGENHDATLLLKNGNVLTTGGYSAFSTPQGSAEIYNPTSGQWTSAGIMSEARAGQTATLLNNGKVLVAGGDSSEIPADTSTTSADLFIAP